jgi:cardiolipin synthase A/B
MKLRLNIWFIPLAVAVLFFLYIAGGILYFNATPIDKRVTEAIVADYAVDEGGFLKESGLLIGRSWVTGNGIEILDNGEEIFETMLDAIRSAEYSITKETYNFWGENTGTPIAEELARAAERGVKVHFLMDFVGSRNATRDQIRLMEEAGVQVVRWRQPSWYQLSRFNHRTHRKLFVVDGKTAFTGGVNIGDDWRNPIEGGGFRDYHYKITGPAVQELQRAFSENWVAATGRLLTNSAYYPDLEPNGDKNMQVTTSHPREGQKMIRKMYLYAISSARESIRINTSYFFPDHDFLDALADASNRGVHVQIIVPGPEIDQAYFRFASKNRWKKLLKAGVEIYEYQPSMYHSKLLIVDDLFVSVGSANFDNRSFRINDETNLNILDREFAEERIQYFKKDLKDSRLYTLDDFYDRSAWRKFVGWITQAMGPHL